jgi:hypothetical protein
VAQAVSRRPLITKSRVPVWVCPREIQRGLSGTRSGVSPGYSVSYANIIPPWLSILIYIWGMNNRPVGGCSSETPPPPSTWTTKQAECYSSAFIVEGNVTLCKDVTEQNELNKLRNFVEVCTLLPSHAADSFLTTQRLYQTCVRLVDIFQAISL